MLEPRETDIPALLLVFIVLPLVAYVLLGKWGDAAIKKERVSLLALQAAEEAFRAENMGTASFTPLVPLPDNKIHQCARCYAPATTRCSRCKSARYCSGKCQIIHWRLVHKYECQQQGNSSSGASSMPALTEDIRERVTLDDSINSQFKYNEKTLNEQAVNPPCSYLASPGTARSIDDSGVCTTERRSMGQKVTQKDERNALKRKDTTMLASAGQPGRTVFTTLSSTASQEAYMRHKMQVREGDSVLSELNVKSPGAFKNGNIKSKSLTHRSRRLDLQTENVPNMINNSAASNSLTTMNNGANSIDAQMVPNNTETTLGEGNSNGETEDMNCSPAKTSVRRSKEVKNFSQSSGIEPQRSSKSTTKASREDPVSKLHRESQTLDDSEVSRTKVTMRSQGSNGVPSTGIMKMVGLMKSGKPNRQEPSEVKGDRQKKGKMLFPYSEFVKFFRSEVYDLSPRGLINCGNSCYANAVLQCLTCTKPLTIYLLCRSHSKAGCGKDWCLMCELEQHVMMLRQIGDPLSPSRILSHMRSVNCQIGDGSQEDAHEFLRLLVASMQSACLDSFGGENVVDPRLQETTFIQHTFGGRLKSKVKCSRCHHESERYENIMDLTLEIFGWVESLEDALTQFTSPEDLDGENMYRCGRCTAYVRARKQLSIQEAPNILTIVLKRFQEGSYGKINKYITFPEMLDMIPYMTGTDDIPPLYMLYAVVVHLDTLNASFSGHYISYIKDLQGNWCKIDDAEVQPVDMSQVMSEGAYILFYMRSSPRPATFGTRNVVRQVHGIPKNCSSKTQKSSRPELSKSRFHIVGPEPSQNLSSGTYTEICGPALGRSFNRENRNGPLLADGYAESLEFSDATSSDWSLFASSDESSFTTESTRDSFSTVDYADASNVDPISSIFNKLYPSDYPSHRTVSCSIFSSSKPLTKFVSETTGSIFSSHLPVQTVHRVQRREYLEEVSVPSVEALYTDSRSGVHVNYVSEPRNGPPQTTTVLYNF